MNEQNYNINEILQAVDEIYKKKKINKTEFVVPKLSKENSEVPMNTLRLIEEAEKNKK